MNRILSLIVLVILSACSAATPTATPAPTATPTPRRIALVMKTLTNPFFVEMERGARRAEQEFGVELIVRVAAQETSIEQQIEIIEQLTREQVDAIVIAPGDSRELIPSLKKAQEAGIVIVNIDNRLDADVSDTFGLTNVPFISVDNEQGGFMSASAISAGVTEPTEAIILEGIRTAKNAEDRKNGALRAFAENDNITVVATETANWKIDEAYTVISELFAEYPDVKLVFAANDMMALGVVQYLQENNRTDVMVAGYDALEEAKAAIRDGHLAVTIDQQAGEQGYLGIKYAVDILNGQQPPAETMVDVIAVNAQTLQ
jgi:ribose transport system substrate-binding protein